MNVEQVDDMRHALGLNRSGVARPYRNRFVCGDDAGWNDLVARGYAVKLGPYKGYAGDYIYCVTDRGMAALGVVALTADLEPSERFP